MAADSTPPNVYRYRPPGEETQRAMIFGSLQMQVEIYDIEIDHYIEIARDACDAIWAQIDLDYAKIVLNNSDAHNAAFSDSPLDMRLGQELIETIELLREFNRYRGAIMWFQDRKERIQLAARLVASIEHGVIVRENPRLEDWESASRRIGGQKPLKHTTLREQR